MTDTEPKFFTGSGETSCFWLVLYKGCVARFFMIFNSNKARVSHETSPFEGPKNSKPEWMKLKKEVNDKKWLVIMPKSTKVWKLHFACWWFGWVNLRWLNNPTLANIQSSGLLQKWSGLDFQLHNCVYSLWTSKF